MVTIESQLEGIEIQQNALNGLYSELDSIKADIEMNQSELEVLEAQSAALSLELEFDRDEFLEVIEDAEDQLIALQNGLCELEDDV